MNVCGKTRRGQPVCVRELGAFGVQRINMHWTLKLQEFKEHDFPPLEEFGAQNELFPPHLKGSKNAAAHVICEKKIHNRREAGKQPRAQLPGMEDAVAFI